MTREDAFIADIIANPADDAIRLIYADWLDGQGREEYGEFIRVQCELANLDPYHRSCTGDKCPGCSALRQREFELCRVIHFPDLGYDKLFHAVRLSAKTLDTCELPVKGLLRRGFIAEVRLSCQDWLTHGPALVRRQPIERVVLTDKKPVTHTPGLWRWAHDEPNFRHTGHSSLLPGELFDLLDGQPPGHWHFDSESSAIDALSAAALLWARQTEPAMV